MWELDSRAGSGPSGLGSVRLGADISTGHGCFPPTRPAMGSITTFTDQFAQVRVGDAYVTHCCPNKGCHAPVVSVGSRTKFVDMRAHHTQRHALSCGDRAATGSIDAYSG